MLLQKKINFPPLGARKTDGEFSHQNCFYLVVKWVFNKNCFGKLLISRKNLTILSLKKDFILLTI